MAEDLFASMPTDKIRAIRETVVVDVQPASRHGSIADVAVVQRTIITAGGIVHRSAREAVFERDGSFSLIVRVPSEAVSLEGDGEFSVLLLLPADTRDYTVHLIEYTGDYDPQVGMVAGRLSVAWIGSGTDLGGVWNYIPIPK